MNLPKRPRLRTTLTARNRRVTAFLEECEEYCRRAGIAKLATLSTHMMNRGQTLDAIKSGVRGVTLARIRKAQQWMADLPPEQYKDRYKVGRPRKDKT